uniref:Plp n=1 Tax=Ganoderma boninense TaxID=34458 RepID=A0A5K1K1N8_9APHY|nr:Plp [Ganoderma boninense]
MFPKLVLVAFFASAAFAASNCPSRRATGDLKNANFWFAFGDSYTARGFNTSGTVPAPGNPFGNPAYPGATGVGANWLDFDTVEFNKSLTLTYDYAVGGSTINGTLVPSSRGTRSLVVQVNDFKGQVGKRPAFAPWTGKNALFSIWFGINDINLTYNKGGDRDADLGARNFLFINIPPMYRTPLMLKKPLSVRYVEKDVITGFNSKLATRVKSFAAKYPSAKTYLWDANTAFHQVLDNPKKYGFTNITGYGQPGDLWGNSFHPSSQAHHLWANEIAALLNGTVWL